MSFLVITSFIFMIFCLFLFFRRAKKDKTNKKNLSILFLGIVVFFGTYIMAEKISADNRKSNYSFTEKSSKGSDRENFYELDNIIEESEVGNKIIDSKKYDDFSEGDLTLEGVVYEYGIPTHVTGAEKGDKYMEVIYPSNETGYSIGLKFEHNPNGFGNWRLTEKYVVETDGVSIPEYERE